MLTDFVGYEKLEVFTVVRACRTLADGRVALKLAESPFYAEGGGQVADEGWIHTMKAPAWKCRMWCVSHRSSHRGRAH